jgi:hypothetical protein
MSLAEGGGLAEGSLECCIGVAFFAEGMKAASSLRACFFVEEGCSSTRSS